MSHRPRRHRPPRPRVLVMSPETFRAALDWRHPSVTCPDCGSGRVVELADTDGVLWNECLDCGTEWGEGGQPPGPTPT
jgi:hypothetical protein